MIQMIDIGMSEAIAYRIEGKVTEEEMKALLSVFEQKLDKNEKLIVYQEVERIGGAEFEAIIEKMKFFHKFGISHFRKIAVVTHKRWLHKLVDLEGKLFKGIEMRGFPTEEKETAIAFLRANQPGL